MRRFVSTLLLALFSGVCSHATDLQSVLAIQRRRIQTADFRAVGHLVRIDAAGVRTTYGITIKAHWFPGVLRVLLEIAPPSNASPGARAHILLEMRPDGQNVIKIAHPGDAAPTVLPFARWSDGPLGPGFSYEDFMEPQYFWPNQTLLQPARYGARDCNLLKSEPGSRDRTHYASIRTWLDHEIGFPVYDEKTLKETGAVKEFVSYGLRKNGGVWSASQIEVKLRGSAGSTLLIIDHGNTKAKLLLADFDPQRLTHF